MTAYFQQQATRTMGLKPGKLDEVRSVLSNKAFATYTWCNSISMVGVWMQRLAIGWLAWQLTGSELWIGAIAFADLLPVVLIGPLAGVWVDRPLRKILIKSCQSIMLLQSLVLFFLAVSDLLTIWLLFFIVLINGVVAAIYHPVRLSVVPSLVDTKDLMAAVSLTAVTFHLARFAGPALGGVVIAIYGIPTTFLVVALSYSVMLVAVFLINFPSRPWLADQEQRSVLSELLDGVAYATKNRAIAYILAIQTVLALCARPIGELLPAFVGSVFSMGAETLAVMTSAMGLGAVLAGLRLLLWDANKGLVNLVISSTVMSGVAVILFSVTSNVWIATGIIFLVAYWITVSGIAGQTLLQTCVDEEKRGRVLSIWAAIYRGAPGIGALGIGWLSGYIGLAWPNILVASVCILFSLWMLTRRSLLNSKLRSL
jgi:predicted MFS family arabinose efflux permease